MTESLRIEIFPADLDRSITFYEAVGFELTGRSDGPPRYASLRLGDVRLGAAEAIAVDPRRRAYPVGTEVVIEVDDVQQVRDGVAEAGVTLTEDLQQRPWGLVDFRITDPDGYYYRLTNRRP
jgi:lactoylglutathione lyase